MWGDKEKEAALEKRFADQDEKLKKLDKLDGLDAIQSEFAEIKKKLDSIEAGGQPAGVEPELEPQPQPRAEMTSFLVDENRAFAERAMPLAAMQLQTAAKIAKMSARNKIQLMAKEGDPYYGQRMARFFDKYEAEVDKYAVRVPLANQGHDETWMNMFKLVQADHLDEISNKTAPFVEGGAGHIPPTNIEGPRPDTLTDAEKHVAKRMGITEADYMESRKGMAFSQ